MTEQQSHDEVELNIERMDSTILTRRGTLGLIAGTVLADVATISASGAKTGSNSEEWPLVDYSKGGTAFARSNTAPKSEVELGQTWTSDGSGSPGTSVIVADNRAFVPSGDTLYALSLHDLTEEWKFSRESEFVSIPAVVDGTVYVVNGNKAVLALDAASGEEQWIFEKSWLSRDVTPVVVDGRVFVASDQHVFALDAESGDELWSYPIDHPLNGRVAVNDSKVFLTTEIGAAVALDVADGEEVWSLGLEKAAATSPPIAFTSNVIWGAVKKVKGRNPNTGQEKFTSSLSSKVATEPIMTNAGVLVGTEGGSLHKIIPKPGGGGSTELVDLDKEITDLSATGGDPGLTVVSTHSGTDVGAGMTVLTDSDGNLQADWSVGKEELMLQVGQATIVDGAILVAGAGTVKMYGTVGPPPDSSGGDGSSSGEGGSAGDGASGGAGQDDGPSRPDSFGVVETILGLLSLVVGGLVLLAILARKKIIGGDSDTE